jgi:hypothetical protein
MPLQTPDLVTLSTAPSGEPLASPLRLHAAHPAATTFCIPSLHPFVMVVSKRPHKWIYNALQKCTVKTHADLWPDIMTEYECSIIRGKLTKAFLRDFAERYTASHGFPRYNTISGRVWRNVQPSREGNLHVLAFWSLPKEDESVVLIQLRRALRLNGPVLVCGDAKSTWT